MALAATTALGLFAGCGTKSAGNGKTFSMWIYSGADSANYIEYSDNPVYNYLKDKGWGDDNKSINIEFWVPPTGTGNDNFATMIGSGDYADVIQMSVSADSAAVMYENGVIMDITEYVEKYMPNYVKYVEEHPDFASMALTDVDGEKKYLQIYVANEDYEDTWHGYIYRRDWLVKYGSNPSTGAAFTGGYNSDDPDDWSDDVMFPSWYDEEKKAKYLALDPEWDGSDPAYLSDWEWMFEIFETAMKDQGINDSYCISYYYPGYVWTGDLCSCFGGGNIVFYVDENGQVQFGGDKDTTRAYLECLNNWYEKGWLDPNFNERTSDMPWTINSTAVRQGTVPMWDGQAAELGGRIDIGGYTEGIFAKACALPINDIYGTEECKYVVPDCTNADGKLWSVNYAITTAAEGKDIGALLSFMDYFYSEEGAVLKTMGLSKEQVKEMGDDCLYYDLGLEDGSYYQEDDGRYAYVDTIKKDSGTLKADAGFNSFPGLKLVSSVDDGYADTYRDSLDLWKQFRATAIIEGTALQANLSSEATDALNDGRTKTLGYMELNAVKFIKGTNDIADDAQWQTWCKSLKKLNYEKTVKKLQEFADVYWVTVE